MAFDELVEAAQERPVGGCAKLRHARTGQHAIVWVVPSNHWRDRAQRWRPPLRDRHLRETYIRTAEHADCPVRAVQCGGPRDGVFAVVGFVNEGIPLAPRGKRAAHVLNHDDVTPPCRLYWIERL